MDKMNCRFGFGIPADFATSTNGPCVILIISVFRKLVATRDIACGELICLERPLNRGPKPSTRPVCLGCYLPLQSGSALCPEGCGWPVCSEECPLLKKEHRSECEHFRRCNFKVEVRSNAGCPICP